jgi:hypothetical protein
MVLSLSGLTGINLLSLQRNYSTISKISNGVGRIIASTLPDFIFIRTIPLVTHIPMESKDKSHCLIKSQLVIISTELPLFRKYCIHATGG